MIFIKNRDHDIIGQSKNLRGINDRCRKMPGAKPWVYVQNDKIIVDITWPDSSFAIVEFGSENLAYKYANTKRFQGAAK